MSGQACADWRGDLAELGKYSKLANRLILSKQRDSNTLKKQEDPTS